METRATQTKKYSDLRVRTRSALIVLAFYAVFLILSFFTSYRWTKDFIPDNIMPELYFCLEFICLLMLTVVLFFAAREITNLFFAKQKKILIITTILMFVWLYSSSLYYIIIKDFTHFSEHFNFIFLGFVLLNFACIIISYVTSLSIAISFKKKKQVDKKAVVWYPILTTVTTIFLIAFLYVLVIHEWTTLLILVLIPTLSDVFGYLVGSKIGKHKLAPNISPKKSWEGLIFGAIISLAVITAIIACFVYADYNGITYDSHLSAHVFLGCQTCWFGYEYNLCPYFWSIYISVTLLLIIVGTFGDLFFSYAKRKLNIKDFSNILPGHGGILDRIDSLVFVFILYFLVTIILQLSTREGMAEATLMWVELY